MKIVIVGGGAIGRLFGSYLAQAENEVTLVDIDPEVVEALQVHGIGVVVEGHENYDFQQGVSVQAVTDATLIEQCDLVLLMVKSFATRTATRSVAHLVSEQSPLLSIQTGLGNIEIIQQIVPIQHVLVGFTYLSGTALGSARVRYGRPGQTYIGEVEGQTSKRLQRVADVLESSGIATQISRRVVGRLWCKVIVFSAINSLSSILKVPNGYLTTKMESITLMKRLLDEGKQVADAHGVDLVYPDLYELLFDACQQSASNLSSMLQDILNERATEVDAQNGAICRYAQGYGISVPSHQTMLELVKLLEKWRPGREHF